MKTIITLAFLFFVSLTPVVATHLHPSMAIKKPIAGGFDFFRAHRQGAGVALSWAPASADVAEFIVERSDDGEYYLGIATVRCNGLAVHKLKDETVFPGEISYRITAIKADGTSEHSPVQTVRIVRR